MRQHGKVQFARQEWPWRGYSKLTVWSACFDNFTSDELDDFWIGATAHFDRASYVARVYWSVVLALIMGCTMNKRDVLESDDSSAKDR